MNLVVAIIGRPNVGKSTLFNRLAGKKLAIVDNTPGVTRDRREAPGKLADLQLSLIDTAGLEEADAGSLEARMRAQTEQAVDDADVALLVIDARAGITPLDEHFAGWLRGKNKPVILVANKCEGRAVPTGVYEAYGLGLGDPIPFSAEHGDGLSELYDALRPHAEAVSATEDDDTEEPTEGLLPSDDMEIPSGPMQLAIVGRPNVGKSTLVNRLIGDERLLTGPEAGITRDAIAIEWQWRGQAVRLIDTAGMRRKAKVVEKLENLSVEDSRRAVQFAQVVVLLIDGQSGLEKQDLLIASHVIEEGRALIICVNKWDAVSDKKAARQKIQDRLETSLPQVRGIKIVYVSALKGSGVDKLMPAVKGAYDRWNMRIPTSHLNQWLDDVLMRHPPPVVSGRRLKIRYITQAKTRPPTFVIFASRAKGLPDAYRRYIVNGLRETFDMPGVPIRLMVRQGKNPYAPNK